MPYINVYSVNFQRIMPKANIFKSSEVFKHLNAEAMKTRADKEQETKRWTTFLQKPDRPIPKSKAELERERRQAEAYRIVIRKQPKPRCAPNRTPSPPKPLEIATEPLPEPEQQTVVETIPVAVDRQVSDEDVTEAVADSEVPNLEQIDTAENGQVESNAELVENNARAENVNESVENLPTNIDECKKTEEELLIEKQLVDVQKQLMALSTLPLTIQATLDAVTRQLAEIMPTMKLQTTPLDVTRNGSETVSTDEAGLGEEGRQ